MRSGDLFLLTGVGTVTINILQFAISSSFDENLIFDFFNIFEDELLKSMFFFKLSTLFLLQSKPKTLKCLKIQ